MNTLQKRAIFALFLLLTLTLDLQFSRVFAQGALTPPGAPAPTMKSLDQVEPRTIINAANTPGDGYNSFIVSKPGSYYLATNLTGAGDLNGIEILTNNVTLDLNGFALLGNATNLLFFGSSGIYIPNSQTNLIIRNGTITYWSDGVNSDGPLTATLVLERLNVANCNIIGNSASAIYVAGGAEVRNCNFQNNFNGVYCGGNSVNPSIIIGCMANNNAVGIDCNSFSHVSGCTVSGNVDGIVTGDECLIADCVAMNNLVGIIAGNNVSVKGCIICSNLANGLVAGGSCQVGGCALNANGSNGVTASIRATVTGCTANYKEGYGIDVGGDSVVTACHASFNGATNSANAGIYTLTGTGSHVDGNQVRDNYGYGIQSSTGDVVVRNFAGGNSTANFSTTTGANFGPIQSPSTMTNTMGNVVF